MERRPEVLIIKIEGQELWDEQKQEFVDTKSQILQLEHSLVSISKWEAKWHKPFLSTSQKTAEETLDYIRFMTITQNVNPNVYKSITKKQVDEVNKYIDDPMSAKIFRKPEGKGSVKREITSDDIYYYMIAYQIPFECQKWHFNRLMTLIKLCDEHNQPDKKKRNKNEYARWRSKINNARKAKYNTRG